MERRAAKVIMGKAGGNAGQNAYNCKVSLPNIWIAQMGLSPEKREVELSFDGDTISIQRADSSVKSAPLAEKRKIRCFALIWQQMYKNHAVMPFSFFEDLDFVGKGLADLGFVMDSGESLKESFPETAALRDCASLQTILYEIDLQTLGNAIFSQWRYWNHWSMAPMEDKDFEWFVIAFGRLAELATA